MAEPRDEPRVVGWQDEEVRDDDEKRGDPQPAGQPLAVAQPRRHGGMARPTALVFGGRRFDVVTQNRRSP
jgi:hypothetical protein